MISIPRGYGFRSGVGATVEDGTQDDWSGVSPNGRQWRNPLTREVRNLSGSAYWELRKAQSADEIIKPDVWTADGKANIKAFSDEALGLNQKKAPAKKTVPIAHQIVPQEKTLDRLDKQEAELYKAFEKQEISEEEFKQLIFALEQKRHRAWKSRCKALGISSDDDPDESTDEEMLPEWQDRAEIVGKNNVEKRDWWEGGNVFILTHKKLKDVVKSALNKKLSVDKEKLSPYIGGVVLSFITFVILF
jgi:hypothetical protein